MYGRPFGKSLCHAWGAGPILLLGKYFLGVRPLLAGYKRFTVTPCLGGFAFIRGTVPTPDGEIEVYMDREKVRVDNRTAFGGTLVLGGQTCEIRENSTVELAYTESGSIAADRDR